MKLAQVGLLLASLALGGCTAHTVSLAEAPRDGGAELAVVFGKEEAHRLQSTGRRGAFGRGRAGRRQPFRPGGRLSS